MAKKQNEQVERERVCDAIRKAISQRILDRKYKPGEKITELALAREFGTSQAPVREALRELEASGLVCTQRYRGTRVREVSPREQAEAYRVRGTLEQLAAQSAFPELAEHVQQLKACCDRMESAAKRRQVAIQAKQNHEFHRLIVEASGNSILLRIWDSLAFEARTHSRLKERQTDPLDDAKSHRPIVDAVQTQDAKKLGQLLFEHSSTFARCIEKEHGCG